MKQIKRLLAVLLALVLIFTIMPSNTLISNAATKKVATKSVKLNKSVYTLSKGKTFKLKATVSPKNAKNKKLVFSSSKKSVATVSSKGLVKAKKKGTAKITVKVKGTNKKASCKIIVGVPVTKVKLNRASQTLNIGQTSSLKATVSPAKASTKTVTWTSSNKKIATVDKKGKVKAISAGKVNITATTNDGTGKKAVCKITVNQTKTTPVPTPTPVPAPTTYTVSFESNGGSSVTAQLVESGKSMAQPANPTKEGYNFKGWFLDSDCTIMYDFESTVTENLTLYAKWEEIPEETPIYTIHFESNGGSSLTDQQVEAGNCIDQPEDPERSGYRLLAWYLDSSFNTVYDFNAIVTSDLTLYAKWEAIPEEEHSYVDESEPDLEIYSFDIDKRSIPINETESVTFTSEIFANIPLEEESVALYEDSTQIGYLNDSGQDGDLTEGDGIYTLSIDLSQAQECEKLYHIAVDDLESESLNIGYYQPISDEAIDDMEEIDSSIASFLTSDEFQELSEEERVEKAREFLNSLAAEGKISQDSISYDETSMTFSFAYNCGIESSLMIKEQAEDTNASNSNINPDAWPEKTEESDDSDLSEDISMAASETTAMTRKVKILNGFENSSYRRDFYNDLEEEWDEEGLDTTVDVDVTVDDMKNLTSNNEDVIVFAMHGTIQYFDYDLTHQLPGLCINQVVSTTTDRAYSYELNTRHSVYKIHYVDGTSGYIISPRFFNDNYNSTSFDNMLFFSETCMFYGCDCNSTSVDKTMAETLTGLSAEAVIGYHNSVGSNYSRNVMKMVIAHSFDGKTVNASLNDAIDEYGSDDNIEDISRDKYKAYPYITGRKSFILRPKGSISGTVKDADSSSGISNALVRVYTSDGDLVTQGRTSSSGNYTLAVVGGDYVVKISAGSYRTIKTNVTVDPDTPTYLESFLLLSNLFSSGYLNGTVTNSITDDPVPYVKIQFRRNWNNKNGDVVYQTEANSNGYYEVTSDELAIGAYTMEFTKSGYITCYKNVVVSPLTISSQDAIISPVTSGNTYRAVLTWGANPRDLDSHVYGTDADGYSFHVYYSDKEHYEGETIVCDLDIDDTNGYGPETITLIPTTTSPYYYYIYKYAGSGYLSTSGAQVRLYKGSTLIKTYNVPTDQGDGDYWNVFAIKNGNVIESNSISDSRNTGYAD